MTQFIKKILAATLSVAFIISSTINVSYANQMAYEETSASEDLYADIADVEAAMDAQAMVDESSSDYVEPWEDTGLSEPTESVDDWKKSLPEDAIILTCTEGKALCVRSIVEAAAKISGELPGNYVYHSGKKEGATHYWAYVPGDNDAQPHTDEDFAVLLSSAPKATSEEPDTNVFAADMNYGDFDTEEAMMVVVDGLLALADNLGESDAEALEEVERMLVSMVEEKSLTDMTEAELNKLLREKLEELKNAKKELIDFDRANRRERITIGNRISYLLTLQFDPRLSPEQRKRVEEELERQRARLKEILAERQKIVDKINALLKEIENIRLAKKCLKNPNLKGCKELAAAADSDMTVMALESSDTAIV